jgi:hypothetical protein
MLFVDKQQLLPNQEIPGATIQLLQIPLRGNKLSIAVYKSRSFSSKSIYCKNTFLCMPEMETDNRLQTTRLGL